MASFVRRLARRVLPHDLRRKLRDDLGVGAASAEGEDAPVARRGSRVQEVRDLMNAGDLAAATSLAADLAADPATADDGAVALGILAYRRGAPTLAWHELRRAPQRLRFTQALTEYLNSGVSEDPAAVAAEVDALVAERPRWMRPQLWARTWELIIGAGELELADRVFAVLDEDLGPREPGEQRGLQGKRNWAADWVGRAYDAPGEQTPGTDVSFAIVDYGHPQRARSSRNIGDHVQTLSSLGHLVRHVDLDFQGDADLVGLLEELRGRVRPERALPGVSARVHVQTVTRDASRFDRIPEDTWTLAFGWYMHPLSPTTFGMPLHRNLKPIFVSFHCNKRGLLTPEVADYLRSVGPIGCRDWTTVYILLSLDVPAFFSGCLTTTVNTVYPDVENAWPADAEPGYVDIKDENLPAGATTYTQAYDGVRDRTFAENIRECMRMLQDYRRDHSRMVTSRLHCYLPSRSIGGQVDFYPRNFSDIRFAGLNPLDATEFDAIRDGILDKLQTIYTAIFSGRSTEEVYALWREITAGDVAAAHERFGREARPLAAAAAPLQPAEGIDAAATQVVVHHARQVPADALRRTLTSLADHATGPVQVWLLDERGDLEAPAVEGVSVATIDVSSLRESLPKPARGNAARFATTQLDALLPGVSRAVVLPAGALVLEDVASLPGLDLGGHAFAAAALPTGNDSGFGLLHAAGSRLAERTDLSEELRRTAHGRHVFDFTAFDVDVMVVDLERWASEGWSGQVGALAREYGLTDREALHYLAGPDRAELPRRWNAVPTRMVLEAPALVHYVDEPKPWAGATPGADLWTR